MTPENEKVNISILERSLKREQGLRYVLLVSLACMTIAFMSKSTDTKTILTPIGTDDVSRWVTKNNASQTYLKEIAEKVISNAFIFSPKTIDQKFDSLLQMSDPIYYGLLNKALLKKKEEVAKSNLSSVFFPTEFKYSLVGNDVVVTGILKTFSGEKPVLNRKASYLFNFNIYNQNVTLASFSDVTNIKNPFTAKVKE
ncbi:TraE/TraK family type IV conjugative transfer system protein [Thiomicrorhabdus hydrogeniphila]